MLVPGIAEIRLQSQQIAATKFKTAKEIVHWMGAMQAQDYVMAKWAIGVRLPGTTDKMIEASLDKCEILRTHLMRPTWHFVAAEDISWILELTAPHIRSSIKSRHKELEITGAVIEKSHAVLRKMLTSDKHLTRDRFVNELSKVRIRTDENRTSHLLLLAELDGLICNGPSLGNKRTYTLLENCIPKSKPIPREEALAKLALRYFNSHAPATLQDFVWWSGLPVADARHGFELNKNDFIPEAFNSKTYWIPKSFSMPAGSHNSLFLLPAYDEFIISYKYREAVFNAENQKKSISTNGIFRPVIVVDGQVTGLWKKSAIKDRIIVETSFYRKHSKKELNSLIRAAESLGRFLEKKPELKYG